MVRFMFGVITGFVAKKYYDENKEQVDKNLKRIIKWIDIDDISHYEEFEKKVGSDGKPYSEKEVKKRREIYKNIFRLSPIL